MARSDGGCCSFISIGSMGAIAQAIVPPDMQGRVFSLLIAVGRATLPLALACARKKRQQWQRYEGDERRRRIMLYLQRKGFPYDACRSAAESIAGAE